MPHDLASLEHIVYDICTCTIILHSDQGDTKKIVCDDLAEMHKIAQLTEAILDDVEDRAEVFVEWKLPISSRRHPIKSENVL